jgi:hypothetical protein
MLPLPWSGSYPAQVSRQVRRRSARPWRSSLKFSLREELPGSVAAQRLRNQQECCMRCSLPYSYMWVESQTMSGMGHPNDTNCACWRIRGVRTWIHQRVVRLCIRGRHWNSSRGGRPRMNSAPRLAAGRDASITKRIMIYALHLTCASWHTADDVADCRWHARLDRLRPPQKRDGQR